MFKCMDCGHVFETPNEFRENHGDPGKGYESFGICPECGSDDYEEVKQCSECGEWFSPDELYPCGCCNNCLLDLVTVDNFLDFATTGTNDPNEADTLEDFVLRELYDVNDKDVIMTCSSLKFKEWCESEYKKAVEYDGIVWLPSSETLIRKIRRYITESRLWHEFAEYLELKSESKGGEGK